MNVEITLGSVVVPRGVREAVGGLKCEIDQQAIIQSVPEKPAP